MGIKTLRIPGAESNTARANAVLTALAAELGDEWTVDPETSTITHLDRMGIRFYTDGNNNTYAAAKNPYTTLSSALISGLGNGTNTIYADILTAKDGKTIALSFRSTPSDKYVFCLIWYQNEDDTESCIVATGTGVSKLLYENDRITWDIVTPMQDVLSCWAFCKKANVTTPTVASSLYEARHISSISNFLRLQKDDQKFIGFYPSASGNSSASSVGSFFAVPVDSFDVENI